MARPNVWIVRDRRNSLSHRWRGSLWSWKLSIAADLLPATLPNRQPQTAGDATASRDDIMRFLEVTQAKSRVERLLEGMAKQARVSAEASFKQKVPDATPHLARIDVIADPIFKDFSADERVEAMVLIDQRHLTRSDLHRILSFYQSCAGQKLLQEMPAIMTESMQVGGDIGRKKMGATSRKTNAQIDGMVARNNRRKTRIQIRSRRRIKS